MTKTWSKLKLDVFLWNIAGVREVCRAQKLREQSYKTVTSHIMAEGPANVGSLLLTPLSAMSISPVRNCMNSSRAASSPSDLDARKVSWVSTSGKRCFLELNGHRAAVLILRPLEPGVCQLGDFTGYFLPRDGRTGLKLITESGIKKRSTLAGPSAIMCEVTVL